jgi:hypothetical protein
MKKSFPIRSMSCARIKRALRIKRLENLTGNPCTKTRHASGAPHQTGTSRSGAYGFDLNGDSRKEPSQVRSVPPAGTSLPGHPTMKIFNREVYKSKDSGIVPAFDRRSASSQNAASNR